MELLNVWDYEAAAAAKLDEGAYGYYAGGDGDELTLRDNVEAFRRWQLRPRVLDLLRDELQLVGASSRQRSRVRTSAAAFSDPEIPAREHSAGEVGSS